MRAITRKQFGDTLLANKLLTDTLRRALWSGTAASVLSALTVAWRGRVERVGAVRAINAVSHWFKGGKAFQQKQPSLRYTLPAIMVHHASSVFWSTIFEQGLKRDGKDLSTSRIVKRAAGVTALAWFVDFHLTPKRLTPGFERVVSKRSLAMTYVAFGCGLAARSLWKAHREKTQLRNSEAYARDSNADHAENYLPHAAHVLPGAGLHSETSMSPAEWTPPSGIVRH